MPIATSSPLGRTLAAAIAQVRQIVGDAVAELAPELAMLLDRGIPTPRVGAELGEPVAARAELAWHEHRIANRSR